MPGGKKLLPVIVLDLSVVLAKSLITFMCLLRWRAKSHVIDYCTATWNSGVLFLSTVYMN